MRDAIVGYYRYGPEAALELMNYARVAPGNRPLVARERSMFYLELGWYREAVAELGPVLRQLEQEPESSVLGVRDEDGLFLGETYERAAVPMLMLAARLALQDPEDSAACADRALELNRALGGPTVSPSTWALAALAYEAAGRFGASETTLDQLLWSAPPDATEYVTEAVSHLRAADPRQRSLVVVLLLGPGPYKREHETRLGDDEPLPWAVFDPEDEPDHLSAELRLPGAEPVTAVVVEDLWQTARRSLADRHDRVLASASADAGAPARDAQELLGWWSLPASIQLLRTPVPDDFSECSLLVHDEDGDLVSEELISVTEGWPDGPLFVVRRIP